MKIMLSIQFNLSIITKQKVNQVLGLTKSFYKLNKSFPNTVISSCKNLFHFGPVFKKFGDKDKTTLQTITRRGLIPISNS